MAKECSKKVIQGAFDTPITVIVYEDRVTITDKVMGGEIGKILLYRSDWKQVKEYIESIWKGEVSMNEIEEIIRDRVILELEDLKKELKREAERLQSRSEFTDDTVFSVSLEDQAEGLELAISRIEKRISERKKRL